MPDINLTNVYPTQFEEWSRRMARINDHKNSGPCPCCGGQSRWLIKTYGEEQITVKLMIGCLKCGLSLNHEVTYERFSEKFTEKVWEELRSIDAKWQSRAGDPVTLTLGKALVDHWLVLRDAEGAGKYNCYCRYCERAQFEEETIHSMMESKQKPKHHEDCVMLIVEKLAKDEDANTSD